MSIIHQVHLSLTWISNHNPRKVSDEITYPFPNLSSSAVEVWGWKGNFIPCFITDVIVYPRWDQTGLWISAAVSHCDDALSESSCHFPTSFSVSDDGSRVLTQIESCPLVLGVESMTAQCWKYTPEGEAKMQYNISVKEMFNGRSAIHMLLAIRYYVDYAFYTFTSHRCGPNSF